jgi:hypothetical protein
MFSSVYCKFTVVESELFITATSVNVLTLTHIDTQRLGGLRSSKNAWDWRLCLRTGRNTEDTQTQEEQRCFATFSSYM